MSQERVSGFPETGADLRGSPGTSGEVWETSGEPLVAGRFHSERTSGEVVEKLPGKFGELPGKSGDFPEARGSLTPSQRLAKIKTAIRSFYGPSVPLMGPSVPLVRASVPLQGSFTCLVVG